MRIKVYGVIYAVKLSWSWISSRKYLLIFTNFGILGLYMGPLFRAREKLSFILKVMAIGLVTRLFFGEYFGLAAASEKYMEFFKEHLEEELRSPSEAFIHELLSRKDSIRLYYKDIKWIDIDVPNHTIKIKRGIFRRMDFIVDPDFILDIYDILRRAGFSLEKGRLKYIFK